MQIKSGPDMLAVFAAFASRDNTVQFVLQGETLPRSMAIDHISREDGSGRRFNMNVDMGIGYGKGVLFYDADKRTGHLKLFNPESARALEQAINRR